MTLEIVEQATNQSTDQSTNRPVPNMLSESVLTDLSNSARFNQPINQPINQSAKKVLTTPSRQQPTIPKPFNFQTAKRSINQSTHQSTNPSTNQLVNHSMHQMNKLPTLRSAVINPTTPHRKFGQSTNQSVHQSTPTPQRLMNQPKGSLTIDRSINQSINQPMFPTSIEEEFVEDATSLAAILNPSINESINQMNQLDPCQMADRLSIASKRRAHLDRGSIYGGAGRVLCRTQTQTPNRRSTMINRSINQPINQSMFNSHYSTPARRAPQSILTCTPVTKPRPIRSNENDRMVN